MEEINQIISELADHGLETRFYPSMSGIGWTMFVTNQEQKDEPEEMFCRHIVFYDPNDELNDKK